MTANTVWLKGEGLVKEADAAAAITPGNLIHRDVNGRFARHNVAGARVLPMFALEADFVGRSLVTAYGAGERVQAVIPEPGAEIFALVPAGAVAIAIGDLLESNGDGTLRRLVPLTDASGGTANRAVQAIGATYVQAEVANNFADLARFINDAAPTAIARALEAVNNSGGGTEARIRVEIVT